MKKQPVLITFIILVLLLSACASAKNMSPVATQDFSRDGGAAMEMPALAPESIAASDSNKAAGIPGAQPAFQQMVIMNANLSIAVDDPGKSMADIQKMASDMGGFTVSSNLYKTMSASGYDVPAANLTVRVPAEKLNEALEKIKALTGDPAKYTLSENITGQDVTQEYTDLKSRLRNLEEADAKLSEFYANATKTEDALAIYQQKLQVTEQIEVIKGQMQYYEQSSSKSAITIQIQTKASVAPITVAGWEPTGVMRDALQALINFGKGFVNFLIWLVILIVPVVLVIGLPIYFLVRWLVRRNQNKATKQAHAQQRTQESGSSRLPPLPPIDKK
jgi:hypothetical protein